MLHASVLSPRCRQNADPHPSSDAPAEHSGDGTTSSRESQPSPSFASFALSGVGIHQLMNYQEFARETCMVLPARRISWSLAGLVLHVRSTKFQLCGLHNRLHMISPARWVLGHGDDQYDYSGTMDLWRQCTSAACTKIDDMPSFNESISPARDYLMELACNRIVLFYLPLCHILYFLAFAIVSPRPRWGSQDLYSTSDWLVNVLNWAAYSQIVAIYFCGQRPV